MEGGLPRCPMIPVSADFSGREANLAGSAAESVGRRVRALSPDRLTWNADLDSRSARRCGVEARDRLSFYASLVHREEEAPVYKHKRERDERVGRNTLGQFLRANSGPGTASQPPPPSKASRPSPCTPPALSFGVADRMRRAARGERDATVRQRGVGQARRVSLRK